MNVPVSTLTEAQAVDELALILDAEPPVEDQLAHIHWAQNTAIRRQQLEQHIERLQAHAPTKEEPVKDLNMPVITPAVDRLAEAVENYNACLRRSQAPPGHSTPRYQAKQWAKRALAIARHAKLAEPVLEPLPPLPSKENIPAPRGARPCQVEEVLEAMTLPTPAPKPEPDLVTPAPELVQAQVAPGPKKVRTQVPLEEFFAVRPAPCACANDCVYPDHHHPATTADLDLRDRHLHVRVDLSGVLDEARPAPPWWMDAVLEEVTRARAKFPTSEHRTIALMEEAGEVVKAALDLHNGRPGATLEALHTEIIQTMAMCVRMLEEGDPALLGVA